MKRGVLSLGILVLVGILGISMISADLTSGLISQYTFEGNAEDSKGVNNGVLVGDAKIVDDSVRGKVLSLDGNGDYVEIPENFDLSSNQLTISVWFNLKEHSIVNGQYGVIGHKNPSWTNPFYLYLRTQKDNEIAFGSNDYIRGVNVETNNWIHIVGVYGDRKLYLYKDGVLISSQSSSVPRFSPVQDLIIGYMPTVNSPKYFNGNLDNIRIYNRALTASDVNELYTSESSGNVGPPSSACGDGACNGNENCSTCSGDCGSCVPSCVPKTCSQLGKTCGSVDDSCGIILNCGSSSISCSQTFGTCSVTGTKTCLADGTGYGECVTTDPIIANCAGKTCGSDGCGGVCGTCENGKNCINGNCITTCVDSDGGLNYTIEGNITQYPSGSYFLDICANNTSNILIETICKNGSISSEEHHDCTLDGMICKGRVCINSCIPKTCSQLGKTCGGVSDGCGGSLNCGSCASGSSCQDGACIAETPLCQGCSVGEKCYLQGIRFPNERGDSLYCDIDDDAKLQKDIDESCMNNFECKSNTCSNNKCVGLVEEVRAQAGLLTKIWCTIIHPISKEKRCVCIANDETKTSEEYTLCLNG